MITYLAEFQNFVFVVHEGNRWQGPGHVCAWVVSLDSAIKKWEIFSEHLMLVTFHHLRVYLVKKGSYYLSSNRFLLHERRGIFLSPTSPPFSRSVTICWYTQETWRNAKKMGEGGGDQLDMDGHPVQGGVSFTTVPLTVFVPFVAKKIF